MKSNKQKIGIAAGLIGAILGGLIWIIIVGIVLRSALFIAVPSIIAVASLVVFIKIYYMFPQRWLTILGALFLFLAIVNIIFINILYPIIPDYVGEISTGKNQMSLLQVYVFLAMFFVWGIFCILIDYFKKKKDSNTDNQNKIAN